MQTTTVRTGDKPEAPDPTRAAAQGSGGDATLLLPRTVPDAPVPRPVDRNAPTVHESRMESRALAVIVTVAFSAVGVLGDYFLKIASQQPHTLRSPSFYVGFAVYASTAFGWVYVMKHLKLGTIGVVYSVSMVLLLTAIGVVGFRESLNAYEVAGLVMAITSLALLTRFA